MTSQKRTSGALRISLLRIARLSGAIKLGSPEGLFSGTRSLLVPGLQVGRDQAQPELSFALFVVHYSWSFSRHRSWPSSRMTEVFPNPPITEALIDIRVQLPGNVSLADLENLHTQIKHGYPDKKTRNRWEGTLELKGEKEPLKTIRSQIDGYLFSTPDGKQVAQYRLDGFTFSRLRPYSQWEDVYREAARLWDIYRTETKPLLVTRLAVRYINSIEIPSKSFDYDDYFTAAPKIPQGLPQLLQHFFTRLVIPFPEQGAVAIVMQTPSDKQDPVNSATLLDIDVFAEVKNLSAEDARIDEIFGNLRKIKNDVFFNSITEKTKELFR